MQYWAKKKHKMVIINSLHSRSQKNTVYGQLSYFENIFLIFQKNNYKLTATKRKKFKFITNLLLLFILHCLNVEHRLCHGKDVCFFLFAWDNNDDKILCFFSFILNFCLRFYYFSLLFNLFSSTMSAVLCVSHQ